ncbi:MAG: hypothetical protein AAGH19_10300 [Pseudomonadota bacterium]
MRIFSLLALILAIGASPPASALSPVPPPLSPGLSAVWFDAERPGTGWVLEMLSGERAAAYWFGYDQDGNPVWQTGVGVIERDFWGQERLEFDTLYAGSGARFGAEFDPDDVRLTPAPGITLSLWCEGGGVRRANEEAFEPLNRLTYTMGAGCEPRNGIPGFPVMAYAGQSGSWYNTERNGEGVVLQWMSRNEALVYWFTYDTKGAPLWLVGVGQAGDDAIEFPILHSARRLANGDVELTDWGSMALALSCNSGSLSWSSSVDGFGSGGFEVTRLTKLLRPACPTVRPTFTQLYPFMEVTDLPFDSARDIVVQDMADNGDVLAFERVANGTSRLVVLPSDAEDWRALGGPDVDEGQAILLTNDGEVAYAGSTNGVGNLRPFQLSPEDGLTFLAEFPAGRHALQGASLDRTVLSGRGQDGSPPWTWSASLGYQALTLPADVNPEAATPVSVANNGAVAVGFESFPVVTPPPTFEHFPQSRALRWNADGSVDFLFDPGGRALGSAELCDADCSLIYGVDTAGLAADDPKVGVPWFLSLDGRFGRLDGIRVTVPGQNQLVSRLALQATSEDGSLVVGNAFPNGPVVHPAPRPTAFIWTQASGAADLRDVLALIDAETPRSSLTEIMAVALTSDGRQLLYTEDGVPKILNLR